jgi:hypothetical protein
MKLWCCSFLMLFSLSSYGYLSGIAIENNAGSNMQVFINGKLCSKKTDKFVRVRSSPGVLHVELRVFNKYIKQWQVVRKDVRLTRGYDSYFKVVFVNRRPVLKETKKYPVYSKYFLNHALYNKHPIS